MSPGSNTVSYPAFAHIGLRENPGKNLNQFDSLREELDTRHGLTPRRKMNFIYKENDHLKQEVSDLQHCSEMRPKMISGPGIATKKVNRDLPARRITAGEQLTAVTRDLLNKTRVARKDEASPGDKKVKLSTSRAVASWSKASCLGLALRNAFWFESSWGKKFSHEISASVWDRCPPSIVMNLGATIGNKNPVTKTSYKDWGAHRANHTIPPFWLGDRPPLLQHVAVRPAAGWSVLALPGL
ncbi:hypothetical protein ANN_12503 [Periplaneta americana]|uniref:Uncharacterized protein n=1 Tax=Periplaneta americana TaxID=6978 RepID=A0ABQ8TIW1_PERAM|nr:hypothetical protein ANN_12503 [Periplaneta americana]